MGKRRQEYARWSRAIVWGVIACGVVWLIRPAAARAAGNESTRRAYDLMLNVDTRWAGGANGGYYPIRIRLANTARPRELLFRLVDTAGIDSKLPSVERRIQVTQSETVEFTLPVPLVGAATAGELRVYERGRLLEQFTQAISFPDMVPGSRDTPSLLVIHPSPGAIDCTKYEDALQSLAGGGNSNARFGGPFGIASVRSNDYQVVVPTMLPESWLFYTTLDVVAVSLSTLDKLSLAARTALLQWVDAGGTLVVFETGEPGSTSKDLARLLELDQRLGASRVWVPAEPAIHRPIAVLAETAGVVSGGRVIQATQPEPGQPVVDLTNKPVWPVTADAFSHINIMAGRVFVFPGNPFPGSGIDWAWWLNSAGWSNRLTMTSRLGNSSRQKHSEFFQFLVPGVGAVPVIAFVVLITVFAIVIGPVNYFVVWKRKQLYLLVVTIPVLAFATSCALFGYAMIADGFSTQSRLRSFTLLDQGKKTAVSFNRISLYSGLAPSAGLNFSSETAVFPIWPDDVTFESGSVDWTSSQHLANGWLRSRTPTQFQTIAHRPERGRVDFTALGADQPLEAVNRLSWTIEIPCRPGAGSRRNACLASGRADRLRGAAPPTRRIPARGSPRGGL
jgi:hypothetical protein